MSAERWIAVIDYGVGNLRSVYKALEAAGGPRETAVRVVTEPASLQGAAGIVLPGVGAFGDAAANLRAAGFETPLLEAAAVRLPLLGICVGMQLLFDESEEMGRHRGLGMLAGRVVRFAGNMQGEDGRPLKVPHIGWNQLHQAQPGDPANPAAQSAGPGDPLLAGIPDGAYAYFVHSYYCAPEDRQHVVALTDFGIDYAAVVRSDNTWGIQCHPEKSQDVGLRILRNFVEIVTDDRLSGHRPAAGPGGAAAPG